jgi:hypothetical protein
MLNVNEAREVTLQHHERNEELRAVLTCVRNCATTGLFVHLVNGTLTDTTIDALLALGYDVTITEKGITVTWI